MARVVVQVQMDLQERTVLMEQVVNLASLVLRVQTVPRVTVDRSVLQVFLVNLVAQVVMVLQETMVLTELQEKVEQRGQQVLQVVQVYLV